MKLIWAALFFSTSAAFAATSPLETETKIDTDDTQELLSTLANDEAFSEPGLADRGFTGDRKPAILHEPSDVPVGDQAALYQGLGEGASAPPSLDSETVSE